ncbi:auxin-induced protein 22D-like [Impatiens glandulifera]|uniref:auxin-induced protein 22D-like n=1 Tax=Impatiens glandulifera TaxID=253017 RepID=UPI001FB0D214|nr:auxin-induced protein 22D-like [Impatiens glandulifera]
MGTTSIRYDGGLNLKATELTLGLPGREEPERNNKRSSPMTAPEDAGSKTSSEIKDGGGVDSAVTPSAPKAQVVGWPPVRSNRKNSFQVKKVGEITDESGIYVKVSMDGAPYLRKIDLKLYNGYPDLWKALENMFKITIGFYSEREGYKGSEYAPTYEDKDGDWMLVGDVPWEMFMSSCKRLRIMKGSEAKGLGCVV